MRNLYELYSERAREFLCTWGNRRPGTYIVVSSEPRSLRSRDLSLWRVIGIRVSVILGCLSIWERHVSVMRSWYVMCKIFPYTSIRGDYAWPRRTRGLLRPVVSIIPIGVWRIRRLWWCRVLKVSSVYQGSSIIFLWSRRPCWGHPLFLASIYFCRIYPYQYLIHI